MKAKTYQQPTLHIINIQNATLICQSEVKGINTNLDESSSFSMGGAADAETEIRVKGQGGGAWDEEW